MEVRLCFLSLSPLFSGRGGLGYPQSPEQITQIPFLYFLNYTTELTMLCTHHSVSMNTGGQMQTPSHNAHHRVGPHIINDFMPPFFSLPGKYTTKIEGLWSANRVFWFLKRFTFFLGPKTEAGNFRMTSRVE